MYRVAVTIVVVIVFVGGLAVLAIIGIRGVGVVTIVVVRLSPGVVALAAGQSRGKFIVVSHAVVGRGVAVVGLTCPILSLRSLPSISRLPLDVVGREFASSIF